MVLVRVEAVGGLFDNALSGLVVGPWVIGLDIGGSDHDPRTPCAEGGSLLLKLLVWEDEDGLVAPERSDHCETRAGVAAGGLDDRSARLEGPRALRLIDDVHGDAVLDTAARLHKLNLGVDVGLEAFRH